MLLWAVAALFNAPKRNVTRANILETSTMEHKRMLPRCTNFFLKDQPWNIKECYLHAQTFPQNFNYGAQII
jgi:hypothetical protein